MRVDIALRTPRTRHFFHAHKLRAHKVDHRDLQVGEARLARLRFTSGKVNQDGEMGAFGAQAGFQLVDTAR